VIRRKPKYHGLISFGLKNLITISIIVLTIPVYLKAAPGECALEFLNIPVGAHRISIGQGGFARIEGPQAIFSNPAQLGDKAGVFASYQRLLLDTRSEAAAAGFSLGKSFALGLGINIFEPGDIEGYTSENVGVGNIRSGDYMLRFGISHRGELSYGISFSYYSQRLDNITGQGIGLGLGVSRDFSYGRLALTADNIGPDFKIGNTSAPLPQRYSISAWAPLRGNYLNLVADLSYKRSLGIKGSAGLEYSPVSGFFVRAGTNNDNPLSVGMGIVKKSIGFDYSYLPSSLFGDRHIFSFFISR